MKVQAVRSVAILCCIGHAAFAPGWPLALAQKSPPLPPHAGAVSSSAGRELPDPSDIYKQAMHPLELVRRSLDNWSDSEVAALRVGVTMAKEACAKLKAEVYAGDGLYQLARLCSLGQEWTLTDRASKLYIDSGGGKYVTSAYVLRLNALIRLGSIDSAMQLAQLMIKELPYDAELAYGIESLKSTLQKADDPRALQIAEGEHDALINALRYGKPLKSVQGEAVMSIGELFESGMDLAFLQEYAGKSEDARRTLARFRSAVQEISLSEDDGLEINAAVTRFQLLGSKLPEIKIEQDLRSGLRQTKPTADFGSTAVFVFFPDSCFQCRSMMTDLLKFAVEHGRENIRAYGLAYRDPSPLQGLSKPSEDWNDIKGLPALVVSPEVVKTFGIAGVPLGVVCDSSGTVRYVGELQAASFHEQGVLDRLTRGLTHPDSN